MSTTTKTKTQVTDFTLREPNLPSLYRKFLKELLEDRLKREIKWSTATEIRKCHKSVNGKWVKVQLKKDITYGTKVIARKGDIAWAKFNKAEKVFGMVHKSWTAKQRDAYWKYLSSANYHVRIPALRKISKRPLWKGELDSRHYRCELNEVKEI